MKKPTFDMDAAVKSCVRAKTSAVKAASLSTDQTAHRSCHEGGAGGKPRQREQAQPQEWRRVQNHKSLTGTFEPQIVKKHQTRMALS